MSPHELIARVLTRSFSFFFLAPPSPAVRNPSAVNSRVRVSQSDAMERLVESGGQEEGHKLDGTFAAIRVRITPL